ncbi:hypothetical protein [Tannerella serpentiformis]|jgi:hypothetical protein|uniref:hypothetical protein n=1 Tax=Tannerella serpentiformis TaxID=712710 RepID=UPI0013A533C0|nr:hypothetical protein [Tannerella serpentiformis]
MYKAKIDGDHRLDFLLILFLSSRKEKKNRSERQPHGQTHAKQRYPDKRSDYLSIDQT